MDTKALLAVISADWLIAIAVFVLVLTVVERALAESKIFGANRFAVAVCVSILAVIGLNQTFFATSASPAKLPHSRPESVLHVLLIPYAALAVTIIAALLLLAGLLVVRLLRAIVRKKASRLIGAPDLSRDRNDRNDRHCANADRRGEDSLSGQNRPWWEIAGLAEPGKVRFSYRLFDADRRSERGAPRKTRPWPETAGLWSLGDDSSDRNDENRPDEEAAQTETQPRRVSACLSEIDDQPSNHDRHGRRPQGQAVRAKQDRGKLGDAR